MTLNFGKKEALNFIKRKNVGKGLDFKIEEGKGSIDNALKTKGSIKKALNAKARNKNNVIKY